MNDKNNTFATPQARLDPFRDVIPDKDLLFASELYSLGQDPAYWDQYPVPPRPLGRVRFEGLRQISTFLLPLLLMVVGVLYGHWLTLLVSIPLGLVLGRSLHRKLCRDVNRKLDAEEALDRGRYRVVQILSQDLGIPPGEITLAMIHKMRADAMLRGAALAQHRTQVLKAMGKETAKAVPARASAPGAPRAHAGHHDDDLPAHQPQPGFDYVNPATGQPMVGGAMGVDTGGNSFGQNNGF